MHRNQVDDNCNVGCSKGYHVGSLEYVTGFACGYGETDGDRIVVVAVDPADVVSVPTDCSHQKVRTCRYKVVAEYSGPLPEAAVADPSDPYADDDGDLDDVDDDEVKVYTQAEMDEAIEDAKVEAREDALAEAKNALENV